MGGSQRNLRLACTIEDGFKLSQPLCQFFEIPLRLGDAEMQRTACDPDVSAFPGEFFQPFLCSLQLGIDFHDVRPQFGQLHVELSQSPISLLLTNFFSPLSQSDPALSQLYLSPPDLRIGYYYPPSLRQFLHLQPIYDPLKFYLSLPDLRIGCPPALFQFLHFLQLLGS